VEVLFNGEVVEEAEVFGEDSDGGFEFEGLALDVEAGDGGCAGGGGEESGEHLEGGGFACSVGAEEGADAAGREFKGDGIDNAMGAVLLREVA